LVYDGFDMQPCICSLVYAALYMLPWRYEAQAIRSLGDLRFKE